MGDVTTPDRNQLLGAIADALMKAKSPDPNIGPTQDSNIFSLLLGQAPELLDKLSYGEHLTSGTGEATQIAPETTGGAFDLLSLLPMAAAAKLARGLKAYHGTMRGAVPIIEEAASRSTHFGTAAAAEDRLGHLISRPLPSDGKAPTIYPAHIRSTYPGWTTDQGADWEKEIEDAKQKGFDALFYRNRFEDLGTVSAIPLEDTSVGTALGGWGPPLQEPDQLRRGSVLNLALQGGEAKLNPTDTQKMIEEILLAERRKSGLPVPK